MVFFDAHLRPPQNSPKATRRAPNPAREILKIDVALLQSKGRAEPSPWLRSRAGTKNRERRRDSARLVKPTTMDVPASARSVSQRRSEGKASTRPFPHRALELRCFISLTLISRAKKAHGKSLSRAFSEGRFQVFAPSSRRVLYQLFSIGRKKKRKTHRRLRLGLACDERQDEERARERVLLHFFWCWCCLAERKKGRQREREIAATERERDSSDRELFQNVSGDADRTTKFFALSSLLPRRPPPTLQTLRPPKTPQRERETKKKKIQRRGQCVMIVLCC